MILLPGYRGQYQVLIIEVVDTDGEIRRICESFKKFPFEESVQHPEYKPHLTLAYVKPDFKLANISDYPKEIKATTVHYNEK
jgi:2'-5' RNA ligase